ncbi:MAG: YcaO-like family protein [Acidobacteriota bacterium]
MLSPRAIEGAKCDAIWRLRRNLKYASFGVTRTIPPSATIERAQPAMWKIGVTRIAEVTQLDRTGIPNFVSVRPRDLGPGISYYNGKGVTKDAAKAGAMMEAIERYSGERCDLPITFCTFDQILKWGPAIDPVELLVPEVQKYTPDLKLEWVQGFDLLTRKATYLPLNAVVCPYEPAPGRALFYASTNGLASGNTLVEALCHALCEVIERDALAISLASLELAPAVNYVLKAIGIDPFGEMRRPSQFPLVGLDDLPRRAAILVRKLRAANLQIFLRDITSTAGIPTLDCTVIEGRNVHGGCGTHPDARVALTRALTEAAQSRVACIQGGREDLPEIIRPQTAFDPNDIYGRGEVRPFSLIRSYQHAGIDDDVSFLLNRLEKAGFSQVVAFDLTRQEIGIPVVRVVIPKAEAWTVFHLHTERGVFGPRVSHVLRNALAMKN